VATNATKEAHQGGEQPVHPDEVAEQLALGQDRGRAPLPGEAGYLTFGWPSI
jgi:hypothetical protein